MLEVKAKDERYFWTGWFSGQSFLQLAALYVLLSLADLIATIRMMQLNIVSEGNAAANWAWQHYGMGVFILYKVVLVAFVLLLIHIVEGRNLRLARIVLWGANILMGYIAILHIAIVTAFTYLHR